MSNAFGLLQVQRHLSSKKSVGRKQGLDVERRNLVAYVVSLCFARLSVEGEGTSG
jgi:hypothetical protein